MPKISKQIISKYIKTDCKKFLALSLYRNKKDFENAKKYGMPEPIMARPSANIFKIAGKEAESLLYELIEEEFNSQVINVKNKNIDLCNLFENDLDNKIFLIEAKFVTSDILETFFNVFNQSMSTFKDTIDMTDIIPDIIVKIIPIENEIYHEVLSDGTLKRISDTDSRTKLSIIDVKNTEKSNSGYDAEIIFYAILLTIWLQKKGLSNKYVVTSKNGVFPAALKVNAFSKSYEPLEASDFKSKYNELLSHVEYIEHDQIAIALRKILLEDITPILQEPEKWVDLDWHISKKCGLCDWLAYDEWLSKDNKEKITSNHCYPKAINSEHISQIPFITPAMRKILQEDSFNTISQIKYTDGTEPAYSKHSKLKTDSSLIPKRAKSILGKRTSMENRLIYSIPKSYTTFTNIFITLNFDPSTRIVSSISTKCHWQEYSTYNDKSKHNNNKSYPSQVFFTEKGDVAYEKEMLFLFLKQLDQYLSFANDSKNNPHPSFTCSNYHIYFWDRTQYDELKNLIGKHIGTILEHALFKPLIWLFGTENVLGDYSDIKTPNVSFIKDVMKSNIALDLKFDYTLFEVAKSYTSYNKNISKAFYDPFSDYIPKERLYEIWLHYKNYQDTEDKYRYTAKAQVEALQFIAIQLHKDLKPYIKGTASEINFDIFNDFEGIKNLPVDSKLWYLHQKLNEEYNKLEKELDSYKHAKELETEYKAIVMDKLLTEEEKLEWLASLNIHARTDIFVYKVTEDSKDSKIKDDAKNISLGIYNDPSFLIQSFGAFIRKYQNIDADEYIRFFRQKIHSVFQIDIVHYDRAAGIIAIKPNAYSPITSFLINTSLIDMNQKLYLLDLDKFSTSSFTLKYLKSIKTPLVSHASQEAIKALGLSKDIPGKKTHPNTMAANILWDANKLQNEVSNYSMDLIESQYEDLLVDLEKVPNTKQKEAILASLNKKLSIIWGPPGTGKTQTAGILIKTLLQLMLRQKEFKNILISAFTYQACIELFEKLYHLLNIQFKSIEFYMLKSKRRSEFLDFEDKVPKWMNLTILNSFDELRDNLHSNTIKVIVSPTATLNSFYNDNKYKNPHFNHIGEFIDFALLDEASQCDIANSLGVLYGLKKDSQLVILGDHLQMPPIHKIKPPINLEYHVGSLLDYLRIRHDVRPIMLNINYRSTKDIVGFISTLGYENLQASRTNSNLLLGTFRIIKNPYKLQLTNDSLFDNIFLPENEVSAITYQDGVSSQANLFEATLVASCIIEAYNKFYDNSNLAKYNQWFWNNAVGIVTPHKAQKSLVSRLLHKVFSNQKEYIDNAIDTVERFQGGQRKFIIVSFGVGDPDIIMQEEEFLLSLNRTNVAISRAEDKVIVMISEDLVHHLPEDKEIIKTSKAIKNYVHQYCFNHTSYTVNFDNKPRTINFRVHKESV